MKNLELKISLNVDDSKDISSIRKRVLSAISSIRVSNGEFSIRSVEVIDISSDVAALIPPVEEKYYHWDNPRREDILAIDKDYVIMTRGAFAKLPDYTASEPTLKYNGKMWRMNTKKDGWLFCWCNNSDGQFIDINYRKVLFLD